MGKQRRSLSATVCSLVFGEQHLQRLLILIAVSKVVKLWRQTQRPRKVLKEALNELEQTWPKKK